MSLLANKGSSSDPKQLVPVTETNRNTTLTLASAHALVLLEDGTLVGDPMEKTTLAALNWKLGKGDNLQPIEKDAPHRSQIQVRRRYQFSSALKRMSTLSSVNDTAGRKWIASVKGAPETLKGMYNQVPEWYDETYRWYTRRGSRVLALGIKEMKVQPEQVRLVHFLTWCSTDERRSTISIEMRSSASLSLLVSWCSIVL